MARSPVRERTAQEQFEEALDSCSEAERNDFFAYTVLVASAEGIAVSELPPRARRAAGELTQRLKLSGLGSREQCAVVEEHFRRNPLTPALVCAYKDAVRARVLALGVSANRKQAMAAIGCDLPTTVPRRRLGAFHGGPLAAHTMSQLMNPHSTEQWR